MHFLHQKTSALPPSCAPPYLRLVTRNGRDVGTPQGRLDLGTKRKDVPPARPSDIRIPADLLGHDVFFGA